MPTHQDQPAKTSEPICQHTRTNLQHTHTLNHHANIPGIIHQTESTCQPSGPACIYTETNMPPHQNQHANTQGSTCLQRTNMPAHKDQHAERGSTCQQTRTNTPTEDQHTNTAGPTRRPRTNMPTKIILRMLVLPSVGFLKNYFFHARDQHAADNSQKNTLRTNGPTLPTGFF